MSWKRGCQMQQMHGDVQLRWEVIVGFVDIGEDEWTYLLYFVLLNISCNYLIYVYTCIWIIEQATNDYKTGICYFSAKHAVLRRKSKDSESR